MPVTVKDGFASAAILCGLVIKQFFLCFRYFQRAWLRGLKRLMPLPQRRRLPRQTIKDLQALSAYQLRLSDDISNDITDPRSELASLSGAQRITHSKAAKVSAANEEMITYSVPRRELVHQLNRVLDAEMTENTECNLDGNTSSYRYRFTHKANVVIDPADMAYLAECHGHYKEAERLYYQSIRTRSEALGSQHLDVAIVASDLASLYCSQKRYAEAEPLLLKAIAIQQQAAPAQTETGNSLYQLAKLYQQKEQYSLADPLFQKALTIFRQQLGPHHPKTQATYADLMQMVVTAIEVGKFAELNAGTPPLDLNSLGEQYSWARPDWA